MMIRLLVISFLIALSVGCTPNIVDRDFEQEELDYIKKYGEIAKNDPLWAAPTEESIFLTRKDGISVTIHKQAPDDKEGIMLQNWSAIVTNHTEVDKCVMIAWKLMDFQIVEEHSGYTVVFAKEYILDYVKLKQLLWDISGTRFALPPSGYIDYMDVEDRAEDNPNCEFFELEEDIVEM